jgi:hypothetical protein
VENFPSNSLSPKAINDEKPEEKVVKKITSGNATRRKKPLGFRFREMFLGDDSQGVLEYVFGEVLVPALKDMVTDAVSQGIERMIFGETRPSNRRHTSSGSGTFGSTSRVRYDKYSSNRDDRPSNRRARDSKRIDDVVLDSRADAMNVVGTLVGYVTKYGQTSVRDLYELVGEPFHHTDEKWGWTDLESAGVRRVGHDSYLIVLPEIEPLD